MKFLKEQESDYFSSTLLDLEFHSVLRRRVNEGLLNPKDFKELLNDWQSFKNQFFTLIDISSEIIESAKELISNDFESKKIRSLDAIHIATFTNLSKVYKDTIIEFCLIPILRMYNPLKTAHYLKR